MKWLTTFIMCLLAFQVTAQEIPNMPQAEEPGTKVLPLPFMTQCTPVPADQMLEELYGELGFLEADANIFTPNGTTASGKLRMFLSPDKPHTYTIMIEFGSELYCMVMSGENLGPMVQGEPL